MRGIYLIVVIAVGCISGCSTQTEAAAWALICDAPTATEADRVAPPDRSRMVAQYIDANIGNRAVKAAFSQTATMGHAERIAYIKREAGKHGISSCEFVTMQEQLANP